VIVEEEEQIPYYYVYDEADDLSDEYEVIEEYVINV